MKRSGLIILSVSFIFSCNNTKQLNSERTPQEKNIKRYFADTKIAIQKYREDSQKYGEKNDSQNAKKYQDSIKSVIVGSYIGEHEFTTTNGNKVSTAQRDKPLSLQVTASWCAPCKAEIPALNRIAEKYKREADFVLLFWDTKEGLEKVKDLYSASIYLVPSQEKSDNPNLINISGFKHIMGFPTNYLLSKDKKIVGFSQGAMMEMTYTTPEGKEVTVTKQQADSINYRQLEEEVLGMIAKEK